MTPSGKFGLKFSDCLEANEEKAGKKKVLEDDRCEAATLTPTIFMKTHIYLSLLPGLWER